MFYIYILFSFKQGKLYIGYTKDLRKRFLKHQKGLVESTKNKQPMTLIYYEAYLNKYDALVRERFFKTGWGRQYVKKILKNTLNPKNSIQKVRRIKIG